MQRLSSANLISDSAGEAPLAREWEDNLFWGLCKSKLWTLAVIVQELCESRGGRPELSVLTSLLASVDVKIY